jgi:hypothetical protein
MRSERERKRGERGSEREREGERERQGVREERFDKTSIEKTCRAIQMPDTFQVGSYPNKLFFCIMHYCLVFIIIF